MHCYSFGSGPTIVYLHGWGCDGKIFLPVAKLLPHYNNVMPDFNGFGKSPPPPSVGWTIDDYVSELYLFFLQYNIQKAVIVGHSFGGRVAIAFAARYPQFVKKLLLVAPAGLRHFSFKRLIKVALYKTGKKIGICGQNVGSSDYRNCSPAMKATFVKVVNDDLSRYAKQISCPVLIVNGNNDEQTPLWHAKKLSRLIKNSVISVADGGHFVMFADPVRFAQVIDIFSEEAD